MNRKNFLRLLAGLSMVPFLPAPSTETPEINDQWMPGTEEDGTMRYWVYDCVRATTETRARGTPAYRRNKCAYP